MGGIFRLIIRAFSIMLRRFAAGALSATTIALLALGAQPAAAAVVVYTSQIAFNAAVVNAVDYDFTGIAPANGFVVTSPTVGGVNFASNGTPFVIDTGSNPTYGTPFFSGQGNGDNNPANMVTISLAGRSAFSFTYGSYISSNEAYSAMLNTGDSFNFATALTQGTPQFLGFVSDGAAISSITLTSAAGPNLDASTGYGYAFDVTGFTLADGAPVPEPATWAMMISGFGLAGAMMRRRKALTA